MKPYMKASYALAAAKALVVKSTGEEVKLTPTDKHIYNWMYSQFTHLQSQGKEFFHNQINIASMCDVSLSAVEKFVRKSTECGLLLKKQKKMNGFVVSNSYVVLDILDNKRFKLIFDSNIDKTYLDFILGNDSLNNSANLENPKQPNDQKVIDDYPF